MAKLMVPGNGKGLSAWLGIPAAVLAMGVGLFWIVGTSYVSRTNFERVHNELITRVGVLEGEIRTMHRDMQFCVSLAQTANVPWATCMAQRLE